MDDSTGILRQMLQDHAKHAEEAEAIGSNNAAWHRNRCRALQAAITALETSPAHTSEARDAKVVELLAAAKMANGDHVAPHDCYATGPLTGDPVMDLVVCPGCRLANAIAAMRQEAGE